MNIEQIILNNSILPKAKLMTPALKAFNNPETGINVVKPGALRVIKDCAETTVNFLPIEIFIAFENPIQSLKGQFNVTNITDLYNRSKTNKITEILFNLILKSCSHTTIKTKVQVSDENDPYGDYDNTVTSTVTNDPVQIICQTYS